MSNHTPGPWVISGNRVESKHEHGWANDGWIIARCEGPDAYDNVKLIAAAPDMLAVLEELAESAAHWSESAVPLGIVDRINDAIKRAKGE